MKEKVYRVGCGWEYIQDLSEIEIKYSTKSVEFDKVGFVAITDRATMQVCILQSGEKFGIYTCDHTNGFGEPGVYCNPTVNPFPYDEVKYCAFPMDEEYGLFAFRIGNKWGMIEVVEGSNEEEGIYYSKVKCIKDF